MYFGVKSVKPLDSYRLDLLFENGENRRFGVRPFLDKGIFQELKDKTQFNTVHISFDTVEWDNGADLDPEMLYEKSR